MPSSTTRGRCAIIRQVESQRLGQARGSQTSVGEERAVYAHATWQVFDREPLPLLVLDQPCMFRQRATHT
jgi:hypothetical protein